MADLATRAHDALDALRKADAGRTPGPWSMWDGWGPTRDGLMGFARLGPPSGERVFVHDEQRDLFATRADAEFIAHVANAWPAVLDLLEATIADPTQAGAADCGPGVCYRLALAVLGVTEYDEGND